MSNIKQNNDGYVRFINSFFKFAISYLVGQNKLFLAKREP